MAFVYTDENKEDISDYLEECSPLLDNIVESMFMMQAGDESAVNNALRSFHTIKSNSGIIELEEIVDLCHICEDLFTSVRDGDIEVDKDFNKYIMMAIESIQDTFGRLSHENEIIPVPSQLFFNLAEYIETHKK